MLSEAIQSAFEEIFKGMPSPNKLAKECLAAL